MKPIAAVFLGVMVFGAGVDAQGPPARLSGNVTDTTGGRLPGVSVALSRAGASAQVSITDAAGRYAFEAVPPGDYDLSFNLINFAQHSDAAFTRPQGRR